MESTSEALFGVSAERLTKMRRYRKLKDQVAAKAISAGGVGVIFAICLIFFYLLYEVLPLFLPASMEERSSLTHYQVEDPYFTVLEEQGQVALAVDKVRGPVFYNARSGELVEQPQLPVDQPITAFSKDAPGTRSFALGFADGSVLIQKPSYHIEYGATTQDKTVVPSITYPLGEEPISVLEGEAVAHLAYRESGDRVRIVAANAAGELFMKDFAKTESFLSDEVELEEIDRVQLPSASGTLNKVLLSLDQRWLFLVENQRRVEVMDLRNPVADMRVDIAEVVSGDTRITVSDFLLGGFSLLLADTQGVISQWFVTYNEANAPHLVKVRSLTLEEGTPITTLQTEHRRKGFIAGDAAGNVGLFNTTAEREVKDEKISAEPIRWIAMSPRGDSVLFKAQQEAPRNFYIHNEHPEVSWHSMWNKVWYERYEEPTFTWQSSSASNDFEPKFSLMPLTFGTMKAAFYAMLVAVPLAICGAIYTAYFMAPSLRTKVKPTIELMEAMPTVILGFLAGLWLAPLVEAHLAGVTSILVLTPIFIITAAFLWSRLPREISTRVPDGYVPVILIPVVVLAGALSMWLSDPIEMAFFNGSMRDWVSHDLGIDFDQRNSLVVGLAMGFAVIPTIFSITEDAIFAVPKGLTQGSLALGATPWQTLVRVVMPTASPGIFSALMIGLGRAVGETMIVLMATGNTPIMDMNIFEGLRTLSANIAVEMPEAEVDSTHFRILFLSGLVLFIFTFMVNTTAEVVRQRLREKYGSL
ncbi:ABC transporter permease subunit [Ketobacter sp.]|uniref:ABC transporter permease subunit n=1 Tax=Ketobacter sp. TaxID=2083498 RepID=UPI000F17BA92|nr:ABC transporter permease subunit [Ketobacter sp.]RLT95135.1 MAG: ABC transporter permease subunit [Ketobacter sp.]